MSMELLSASGIVDFYVYQVMNKGYDVNLIKPRWKTDVCVELVKQKYWTIDQVPADVIEAVRAKLIADETIAA